MFGRVLSCFVALFCLVLCSTLAEGFHVVMFCVNMWLVSVLIIAGHLLVLLFCVSSWIFSCFCVPCALMSIVLNRPSCYLIIGSFTPHVFPRYPPHLLPIYSPCVCSPAPVRRWMLSLCLVSWPALPCQALYCLASLFSPTK